MAEIKILILFFVKKKYYKMKMNENQSVLNTKCYI